MLWRGRFGRRRDPWHIPAGEARLEQRAADVSENEYASAESGDHAACGRFQV
jgi:hypothetical protein